MFIWASSFIALKSAMQDLGEYTVIFIRMVTASLCFLYFIKDFLKYDFTKSDIKYIFLLALFEPCFYFIFEAKALIYTSASQAGMITSLMPIITAMAAGFFLKEIITRKLIFGSLIAMFGAVWLSVQATTSYSAPNPMLGNFLEFCAMICAAGYTIVARYLSNKYSALFITAIQVFIGAVFFFPFFIYEISTSSMQFTIEALSWSVYLGIVVTLGGYGLYNFALTKIEASKAAVFVYLIPIFTVFLAYMFLGEKLSSKELIASALILIGVFISQLKVKRFRKVKA
ncbi:DMT family transporter [Arcobacter arenosus]|uniref:DMT family transporter n=2 Tax=Arcobacter arenosus TaxID=2576037 RepID=A0A5R8Y2V3_9BACT|nr:DMT family transporter [Arcobacter arenosus]